MATRQQLTLWEKIDRARDGRSQTWIVTKMNEKGCNLTDTTFSRKKKGREIFTEKEIGILSEILSTDLT